MCWDLYAFSFKLMSNQFFLNITKIDPRENSIENEIQLKLKFYYNISIYITLQINIIRIYKTLYIQGTQAVQQEHIHMRYNFYLKSDLLGDILVKWYFRSILNNVIYYEVWVMYIEIMNAWLLNELFQKCYKQLGSKFISMFNYIIVLR